MGQEDVTSHRRYTTSLKCLCPEGQLYSIKQQEFVSRFGTDKRTWNIILENNDQKDLSTQLKIVRAAEGFA